jgi:hypothetical protein
MSAITHKKPSRSDIDVLETPFEHIALAFSGGGFRAASFGLGTLSFLSQVPFRGSTLLEKVTYMASASGGTIATSTYALNLAHGRPFGEFYKHLHQNLEGTCLLKEAMQMLDDDSAWADRPEKTRNIINAFAMAYDKHLYAHAEVQELRSAPDPHLEEVCFNATELYRGLLFRQSVAMKSDPSIHGEKNFLYGNFIVNLGHQAASKLRIADLLAASSCFPAGFEPIVFPRDFINPSATRDFLLKDLRICPQELSRTELDFLYSKDVIERTHASVVPFDPVKFACELQEQALRKELDICLMDGGITDNQGLESVIDANYRREQAAKADPDTAFKPFDLMLICDVGSHYMDAYKLPAMKKTSWLSINRLRILCALLFVAAGAGTFYIWNYLPNRTLWNLLSLFTGLVSLASLTTLLTVQYLKSFISGKVTNGGGLDLNKNFSEQIVHLLFSYFRRIRFNLLSFMVKERITSVLSLNNDVFLKRIRYLLYDIFFNEGNMKATGRVKANHIYDLTYTNDVNRERNYSEEYLPGEAMQNVAQAAFGMATTLWFSTADTDKKMLPAIVACGQFTTCYNLLDYISKLKKHYPNEPGSVFSRLSPEQQEITNTVEAELKAQFVKFQANPFWLYNELGAEYGVSGFVPVSMASFPFPEKEFGGLR